MFKEIALIYLLMIVAVLVFDLHSSTCKKYGSSRPLSIHKKTSDSNSGDRDELRSARNSNITRASGEKPTIKNIKVRKELLKCKDQQSCKKTWSSKKPFPQLSRRVRLRRTSLTRATHCSEKESCRERCSRTKQFIFNERLWCYCDSDCEFFQDCCADFKYFCEVSTNVTAYNASFGQNNTNRLTNSQNITQVTKLETKDLWSCFSYKDMLPGTKGVWMIGSCPESWPKDDIFYQCRNLSATNAINDHNYHYLPVYTSDGTVYHNRFCAQCNGKILNKTQSYQLFISPTCKEFLKNPTNHGNDTAFNCTLGWRPAQGDPRRYCLKIKSSCILSDSAMRCMSGKVGIVSNNQCIFKNKYCAQCNGAFQDLRCVPNTTKFIDDCPYPVFRPSGFQGLHHVVNFVSSVTSPPTVLCDSGMVYDEYTKVCRETLTQDMSTTRNCSAVWVLLKDGEFLLLKNKSVFVNITNIVYDSSRYIWKNKTLYVCDNFSNSYTVSISPEYNEFALSLMTKICMSTSIIALVFVLITYSLFTELRTPPGINLMNLSASILLAQLLWLTGSGQTAKPIACTVIAVLRHYFFLVSFVWTSIIAFDTWRAFIAKRRRSSSKYRNLRYMTVGWFSVAVYVAVCFILDFTEVTIIGYQASKGCWMSNSSAVLYFFAVPIALLLLFNIVLYCLTTKAIHKTKSQARFAADGRDRKKSFGVYVRIASAMGFTWIFGFIAPFGWDFFWFLFVFFDSLQGVYIALAFVFNQRVMKMYKKLFANNVDNATSMTNGYSLRQISDKQANI